MRVYLTVCVCVRCQKVRHGGTVGVQALQKGTWIPGTAVAVFVFVVVVVVVVVVVGGGVVVLVFRLLVFLVFWYFIVVFILRCRFHIHGHLAVCKAVSCNLVAALYSLWLFVCLSYLLYLIQ